MANLYIAEDGTIHDRDTGNCQCVVPDDGAAHTVEHTLPAVSGFRKFAFWIITLIIAGGIGYLIYKAVGIYVFAAVPDPDSLSEHIVNFFCTVAPYVIIAGALLCAIIYGAKFAARRSYNLGTYFMSALSAAGGTVGVGLAMYCLAMVITVLLYVIAIAFVIAIIAAIVGGD